MFVLHAQQRSHGAHMFCAAECPVDAISQGDTQFVIDADTCIDCGNCANVCPVGAPVQE